MAYKLYMKIDGLTPEDGIEVHSLGWGIVNPTNSGGGAGCGGRAQMNDLVVVKPVDKTSPNLIKGCAGGKHFPTVVITAVKMDDSGLPDFNNPISVLTLGDHVITSVQLSASADGDSKPHEEVHLTFGSIKFDYVVQ